MKLPDIVYIVKPDDINEELKYSLRTLRNVPHGNVIFAGHMPPWVKNVIHVPTDQSTKRLKYQNSTANLIAACKSDEVSDDFILMNDDFFIMKPIDGIKVYNRGDIDQVIAHYSQVATRGQYALGMEQTRDLIKSLDIYPIISYELHVPMMINKQKFLEIMKLKEELAPNITAFHKRTFYGNYYKLGGEQMEDVKIHKNGQFFSTDWTFLSTQDATFIDGDVGDFIMGRFPDKSIYEN